MKSHRIFNKGQIVYCLLSSFSRPNVLLPVKGIIMDTAWDTVNPQYKVRIVKMYDNMKFLKEHFFEMNFKYEFDNRARKLPLKKDDFKNVRSLEERFDEKDRERFFVIVESVMCTKTKKDLQNLFEKVQFYIISKNLKEIKETASRPFYKGVLAVDSGNEFDVRFKKGWSDKFKGTDIDIQKYLSSLS